MIQFFVVLLAGVSLILFTVMIVSFVGDTRKRNHYSECTGQIERIWKRRNPGDDPGKTLVSPIVTYTVNGETFEFVGTSYSPKMKIGQEVVVLYEKENPSKAVLKKGLYFTSVVTGMVGLSFTVAFIILVVIQSVFQIFF